MHHSINEHYDLKNSTADSMYCSPVGLSSSGLFPHSNVHILCSALLLLYPDPVVQIPQAVEEHMGQKWATNDVIPLNGTVEEVEQLRDAMLARRAAVKAKKGKKAAKATAAGLSEADKLLLTSNAARERSQVTSATQAADLAAAVAAEVQARLASSGGAGSKRQVDDEEDTPAAMSEQEKALMKKFKASDRVPTHASKSVYSSIFMSSRKGGEKESYTCRSTSARGMNMT